MVPADNSSNRIHTASHVCGAHQISMCERTQGYRVYVLGPRQWLPPLVGYTNTLFAPPSCCTAWVLPDHHLLLAASTEPVQYMCLPTALLPCSSLTVNRQAACPPESSSIVPGSDAHSGGLWRRLPCHCFFRRWCPAPQAQAEHHQAMLA